MGTLFKVTLARGSDPYMPLFSKCTSRVVVVHSWGRFSKFNSRLLVILTCHFSKCTSRVVVVRSWVRFSKFHARGSDP